MGFTFLNRVSCIQITPGAEIFRQENFPNLPFTIYGPGGKFGKG